MPSIFKAYYGLFDTNMHPLAVIDSSDILEKFKNGPIITLPKQNKPDDLFPNNFHGTKFLQIQLASGSRKNILNDDYQYDIQIDISNEEKNIIMVYYVFINPQSDWQLIISGQLSDLRSYGLLDEAKLYIPITNPDRVPGVLEFVQHTAGTDAVVTQSFVNQFEYPGIKLLYDIAVQQPHKTYMYLHTKGMSYSVKERKDDEQALLKGTFKNWRKNLEAFQDDAINKIGLFPALHEQIGGGWMWFNFFIARGSYLAACENPKVGLRHYYEYWLSHYKDTIAVDDCYSLYTNKRDNLSHSKTVAYMDQLVVANGGKKRKKVYRLNIPWLKRRKIAFKQYLKRLKNK